MIEEPKPPKLALWLLRKICNPRLKEEIEGDLIEFYAHYRATHSNLKASTLFWFHLLSFFRPYSFRKISITQNRLNMIQHYLKYAFRFQRKHPGSTFFNLLSLTLGIGCFLFIFIYIQQEMTFDTFHEDHERIHRVVVDFVNEGERIPDATTPPALSPTLAADIPEVEYATRIFPTWGGKWLMGVNEDKKFYEEQVFRVDREFLEIFDFSILAGSKESMLNNSSNIVLTTSAAKKYFGKEDPLGQTITAFNRGEKQYVVSGVIEDVPSYAHFTFDFLVLLDIPSQDLNTTWGWYNFYTYVKLKPGTSHASFEEKLQPLYNAHNDPGDGYQNIIYSQKLSDIHLRSALKWELGVNNNMNNIKIFIAVGLCIFIVSVINYLNLTLGSTMRRMKEVGIRKSFGAYRINLINQFSIETFIMVSISLILGVVLSEILFHLLQEIFGRRISLLNMENLPTILTLSGVVVLFGVAAGIYPALYFSSLRVSGMFRKKSSAFLNFKNILLIVQFSISAIMIVATLVVSRQLSFFQDSDKGFIAEQVLVIENARSLGDQKVFLNQIQQKSGVSNAALSDGVLGKINWTTIVGHPERFQMSYTSVDPSFLNVLGMEIVHGRNFDGSVSSDKEGWNLIVNESGLEGFGLTKDDVGESFVIASMEDSLVYGRIIGVVKDFHFTDFKSEIKPFAFFYRDNPVSNVMVKIDGSNVSSTLSYIERIWDEHAVGVPFESYFLDQSFAQLHAKEAKLSQTMVLLTALSLFISFIGMLSVVNLAIRDRLKEVAVRKILGASVLEIVNLISQRFMMLVLLSNVIGIPIAYFTMEEWLSSFKYRTELSAGIFIISVTSTVIIAYLIVGYTSLKAATLKLTERLRED